MKIFLIGYEGSKHILPASSYLIKKYIPCEFEVGEWSSKVWSCIVLPFDPWVV